VRTSGFFSFFHIKNLAILGEKSEISQIYTKKNKKIQNFTNFFVGKLPNFAKRKKKKNTLVRTRRVDF
jgi:hypothetical protein